MAITWTSATLMRRLQIEPRKRLLEIGEANWYGDANPADFGLTDTGDWFDVAKQFYRRWCDPKMIESIDLNGTEKAIRIDLNDFTPVGGLSDVVINNGTAEHVFNIANVFRVMHDLCSVRGWMIHDAPCKGWIDHGFYTLQPTLFYDLAAANNYEIAMVALHHIPSRAIVEVPSRDYIADIAGHIPDGAMIFVAFRKTTDEPFRFPTQGYYARSISDKAMKAWESNR